MKIIIITFLSIIAFSCTNDDWKCELEDMQTELDGVKEELANQKKLIEALQKNATISSIEQGEGSYTIKFSDGQSITLTNGKTPLITIGDNGNWFIDGQDTDKPSKGADGQDGQNGEDGKTPTITIGENGNWYINGQDTGIKAIGIKGENAPIITSIVETISEISFSFSDGKIIRIPKSKDIQEVDRQFIEMYRAQKHTNLSYLNNYFENLVEYSSMMQSLNSNLGNTSVYEQKLERYKPFRILFIGSSSTNLQWNLAQSTTCYSNGMNGKPLGMDNENHWTHQVWEIFNDVSVKTHEGTNKNGSMEIKKISKERTDGILISGEFEFNTFSENRWSLGDCLGYPNRGVHEFAFFKDKNSFVEFDIPKGTIGFDIVCEMFDGYRSNGILNAPASDNVELSVNGVKEKISFAQPKSNFHIIKKNLKRESLKVRLTNKCSNKWMGVWGIYYWDDIVTIPSNIAISGGDVNTLLNNFKSSAAHQEPDIIFWQPTINNDGNYIQFIDKQNQLCEKMKTLTSKIVMVIQHCTPSVVEKGKLDLWEHKRNAAIDIALKNGFPIIDWGAYLRMKYGDKLPNKILPDQVHLSNNQWPYINNLFKAALKVE